MKVFIRNLTIPLLIVLSNSIPLFAEGDWVLISSDKKIISYIKKGKWSDNGVFRIYQHKVVPQDGDEPFTLKQLADCENWRYRPNYKTEDKKWRYVSPGTIGDKVLTEVCRF